MAADLDVELMRMARLQRVCWPSPERDARTSAILHLLEIRVEWENSGYVPTPARWEEVKRAVRKIERNL